MDSIGPGCSSMAAWSIENGPFTLSDDGKTLKLASSRWNKEANMLFVESPVGVGYSYSLNPEDYQVYNDNRTASDIYNFVVNFLDVFEEYKTRDFYVAAESYGGHYAVVTVREIHLHNQVSTNAKINLKGFLIGNGLTDNFNDDNSVPAFMVQHALITISQYSDGLKACNNDFVHNAHLPRCAAMLEEFYNMLENINPYAIYATCEGLDLSNRVHQSNNKKHRLFTLTSQLSYHASDDGSIVRASAPCIDGTGMESYFNRDDVRRALHVDIESSNRWEFCNLKINSIYNFTWDSMIPFIQELSPIYRALYYSGDTDIAVNVMGSQASIYQTGQQIVEKWRQWHLPGSKQVAGMIQKWDHITFVTVRGAGHMCPHETMGRPAETLYMFNSFLKNEKFA